MNKPLETPRQTPPQRLRTLLRNSAAAGAMLASTTAFEASAMPGDMTRQADQASLWFVVLMLAFIATLIGGFWVHGRGGRSLPPQRQEPRIAQRATAPHPLD
jgi:hypothetical protein